MELLLDEGWRVQMLNICKRSHGDFIDESDQRSQQTLSNFSEQQRRILLNFIVPKHHKHFPKKAGNCWREQEELTKLHWPIAVHHLLLLLCHHCRVIQSQLGHLTTHALEHGQKLRAGVERLAASLPFQEVWHHLRQLGMARWASTLTAHWRQNTTSQTGQLLRSVGYIIKYIVVKKKNFH